MNQTLVKSKNIYLHLILGLVLLEIIGLLPIVGQLFKVFVYFVAFGGLILYQKQQLSRS